MRISSTIAALVLTLAVALVLPQEQDTGPPDQPTVTVMEYEYTSFDGAAPTVALANDIVRFSEAAIPSTDFNAPILYLASFAPAVPEVTALVASTRSIPWYRGVSARGEPPKLTL